MIVTSGVAEPPEGVRFLPKPYTPEALLNEIEAAIAEAPLEAKPAPVTPIVPARFVPTQAGTGHTCGAPSRADR